MATRRAGQRIESHSAHLVREIFLITRHLVEYLTLMVGLTLGPGHDRIVL